MADGRPSPMPVLVNLFGTVERVALAVTMDGVERRSAKDLREVGELLAFLRQPEPPGGFREAFSMLPLLKTVMAMKPKTLSSAPCQEVVLKGDDIDLNALPIQTCWPGEPAPLITWPLVVTKGPGTKREDDYNLGIYRMQVLAKNKTIMRWLAHRGGAQHHRRWKAEKSEPLPVAAVIGADPGTILAAVTPVPDTLSEYQFAGLLRRAEGRTRRLQDRAAQGSRRSRDRHRGPCLPRRLCRRRPLRRPYRLLQFGREVPGLHRLGDHHAAEARSISRPSPAVRRTSPRCWARP